MTNTILIGSDTLGQGERQLGEMLIANFLRLLGERGGLPERILFWNAGVKLCAENSRVLPHLKRLEESGVSLLLCKTCLEYFDLAPAVGTVSNMNEIQSHLLAGNVLTL